MQVAILGWLVYAVCHLMLMQPRRIATAAMIAVIVYGAVALPSAKYTA